MAALIASPHPRFAVVGHPNKGKSSIVASLAFDDTVQISDTPGTTTRTRSFPLTVDGAVLYELFDTPGFQRARQVLAWLKAQDASADKRPEAVRAFLRAHHDDPKFADEVELLTPIMAGAGILYVVDGSKPYGEEYEAEMEILRWTGQPSMALINRIGTEDYSTQWEAALGQYFKLIRTYDPMARDFDGHIALLEGIAQLRQEWMPSVKRSIALFEAYRQHLLGTTAQNIARLVQRTIAHVERLQFASEAPTDMDKEKLAIRYQEHLRQLEQREQRDVEAIWHHKHLDKEQSTLLFDGIDLFSRESASIFGLTRKEMLITGMAGGAAAGAGIDLLFGGTTFLLGSAIGAVVGGVGAYWGFEELSEIRILGTTLGKRYLEMGPMTNRNFPYILLGRALYHAHTVASRSHAVRGTVQLVMDETFKDRWLGDELRAELETYHKTFRSGEEPDTETSKEYEGLIYRSLEVLL